MDSNVFFDEYAWLRTNEVCKSCWIKKKVFDGRTNDIKEEKSWNEHINVLLDKKNRVLIKKFYKNKPIKGGWLKSFNKNIKNEINKSKNIKLNQLKKSQNEK